MEDLDKCIAYYRSLDVNADGRPDWAVAQTANSSQILFLADTDADGDGIENVLDPSPLDPNVSSPKLAKNGLPEHLALDGERGRLQGLLYRKHGVVAVDHTDQHSPSVLTALLKLFERGFPPHLERQIRSVRTIYAFRGHDQRFEIAAYHKDARAISIGGLSSWGVALSRDEEISVLAALAHELGHAYLLENVEIEEFRRIGTTYGGWREQPLPKPDWLHPAFLVAHPLRAMARARKRSPDDLESLVSRPAWTSSSIVSQYSTTNMHEWFADSFAAALLQRMGENGSLGKDWTQALVRLPKKPGDYWVNYNNLSPEMKRWFGNRLGGVGK